MKQYPKIDSVYKRDDHKRFIIGDFSKPEFQYLQNNLWTATEKVHGTNIRVIWDGTDILFKGKSDKSEIPIPLLEKLKILFPKGKFFGLNPMCLYGEGYGGNIETMCKLYKPNGEFDFILFDILVGNWWLLEKDIEEIAKFLSIETVPYCGKFTLNEAIKIMMSTGFISKWGSFLSEGFVLKPEVSLFCRNGERIITKVKYKDFIK